MLFADSVCPAASNVLPTQWFLSCESDNTPQWIYQALTEVRFSVTQNLYILMDLYNTTVVNCEIKKCWLHILIYWYMFYLYMRGSVHKHVGTALECSKYIFHMHFVFLFLIKFSFKKMFFIIVFL